MRSQCKDCGSRYKRAQASGDNISNTSYTESHQNFPDRHTRVSTLHHRARNLDYSADHPPIVSLLLHSIYTLLLISCFDLLSWFGTYYCDPFFWGTIPIMTGRRALTHATVPIMTDRRALTHGTVLPRLSIHDSLDMLLTRHL